MGSRRQGAAAPPLISLRRGDVFLVTFDPTVGAEIRKTRPAVVIQNDIGNRAGSTTIVAAITSRVHNEPYPFEVALAAGEAGLEKASVALLNQIRTVDRRRLVRKLGTLRADAMRRVDRALAISVGLLAV